MNFDSDILILITPGKDFDKHFRLHCIDLYFLGRKDIVNMNRVQASLVFFIVYNVC